MGSFFVAIGLFGWTTGMFMIMPRLKLFEGNFATACLVEHVEVFSGLSGILLGTRAGHELILADEAVAVGVDFLENFLGIVSVFTGLAIAWLVIMRPFWLDAVSGMKGERAADGQHAEG